MRKKCERMRETRNTQRSPKMRNMRGVWRTWKSRKMQERCELTPTEFEAQYREPLETLRGLRVLRFDCAEPDNPRVYIKTVKRGRAPDYSTS